jgi:hypothetical protein
MYNGNFEEFSDGTAKLTGSSSLGAINITFTGRSKIGEPVFSYCFSNPSTADWYYYSDFSGYIGNIAITGNPNHKFQIGTKGNNHNSGYGGSGWFNWKYGTGDINIKLSGSTSTIEDLEKPTISIDKNHDLSCVNTTATLTATVSSGQVTWSNGQTGNTIQVSTAGTYTATVTNASGCSASTSITVNSNVTTPGITISKSNDLSCKSASATLAASASTGQIKWNTGQTGNIIQVNAPGVYTATITAPNGCTATASITVNSDNNQPSITISKNHDLSCANSTATLTATVSGGQIKWNTNQTSNSIQVNAAGTYSATVTAPNGCTATASITVNSDNNQPSITISKNHDLSCANSTATLTATVSGGQIKWSTNETGTSIQVSAAGTYSATVTAANGCEASASISVTGGCDPCDNLTFGGKIGFGGTCAGTIEICDDANTGTEISNCELPTGGSGDIEYIWLKNEISCEGPTGTVAQMIANPDAYNWKIISDANGPSYNPGKLSITTCFTRCARRKGCTSYTGESNIVRIEVKRDCGNGNTTETCGGNTSITYGNGTITMSGETGKAYFFQVFDMAWQEVYSCGWQCGNTKTVSNLAAGDYRVFIKDSAYRNICEKVVTLSSGSTGGGNNDVDNDNDGVNATEDCNDNDPNLTTVGAPCNDGNPDTDNDIVQANCTCAGTNTGGGNTGDTTTESCDGNTSITYGNGTIIMSGEAGKAYFFQVFDKNWQEVYSCGWQCGSSKTVNGLAAGEYRVFIKNSSYQRICEKVITLSGSTGGGGNNNVDNDNDGVNANEDCNDNDANLTTVGAACDDGNPNTENDKVQANCTCAGTSTNTGGGNGNTVDCGATQITYGSGSITITGQVGKEYFFKINDLNNGWAQAGSCGWNCGHQFSQSNLANSKYLITVYNSDWTEHCQTEIEMTDSNFSGDAGSRNASQLSFSAFQADRTVALEWLTNNGYKVSKFEIERSLDGTNFTQLAAFTNKEWTDELEYHQSTDEQPANGVNYYRVKEIYLDGSYAYTEVQSLGFHIDLNEISVFPNPAREELFVSLKPYVGKKGLLTLTNHYGQIIQQIELGEIKEELIQINTSQVLNGLYYINVQVDQQKSFTKKVMVHRTY